MNADLFIKAVLFLHRYLSSCSADHLRYVRHTVYHKMLTTKDPYEHLWDWLTLYRSRGNGWFLPRLEVEYIVHLLVYVDKFYRKAEWETA